MPCLHPANLPRPVKTGFRVALVLVLVTAAMVARPQPASACIWTLSDYFMPWPPCEVKDENVIHRARQATARVAAMLYETAHKIQQVKREVYQWQTAYNTATDFENQLRRVYGDLTANPLPSLVHTWNRGGIGGYLQLDASGGFSLSAEFVDIGQAADSIANAFLNDVDVSRIYAESWAPRLEATGRQFIATGSMLQEELGHLGDFRRHTQAFRDSLENLGNRVAGRYAGDATAQGDAEAHISQLSIVLSKLHGTNFAAQAMSISTRLQAMEYAAEAEELIHKRDGKRAALFAY